jgi:hypothetical protein
MVPKGMIKAGRERVVPLIVMGGPYQIPLTP